MSRVLGVKSLIKGSVQQLIGMKRLSCASPACVYFIHDSLHFSKAPRCMTCMLATKTGGVAENTVLSGVVGAVTALWLHRDFPPRAQSGQGSYEIVEMLSASHSFHKVCTKARC